MQHGADCELSNKWKCNGQGQKLLKETTAMRMPLVVCSVVASVRMARTSAASAAPINGAIIGDMATAASPITTVQHWRRRNRGGHSQWAAAGGERRSG
jgi:hypothetical protein